MGLSASRYLSALLTWEALGVLLPWLVGRHVWGRDFDGPAFAIFVPNALVGVVAVAVSLAVASRLGRVGSVALGLALGLTGPVAVYTLWASGGDGFEASVGIVTTGVLLAIPSGFAGGVTGWLLSRGTVNLVRASSPGKN